MKKKNAVMLADTRPALVGTVLVQLQKTNPNLFDEAIIYYTNPIDLKDRRLMEEIMPCRFIQYIPPLPKSLFERPRFKHFSVLMFARYEMFQYLDEFETITWLDTDILIQGDLNQMIESAKDTGMALIQESPENKTAEEPDIMRTCFTEDLPGYITDLYLFCSGTIILTDKLSNLKSCTEWCYKKTIQWADILSLPDQGVLNAAIQAFNIQVTPLNGKIYCCYPYMGRDCSDAKIIHSWGLNKFWNDWYIYLHYDGWKESYEKWMALGGCKLPFEIVPRISVVIPSYKPNPKYLRQCLDSLMSQKRTGWERFSDFEIIIVAEPFEQEQIQRVVDSYHDKRVRLEFNSERLGIAASINRGIFLAKGKYIARMDDDDLAAENRMFLQAEYLDKHPEITLCTSDFEYFGDMNEERISFEGEMCRAWSIFTCPFDHPTIMFRKDFFQKNGLKYDEKRGYVEDWELWQRAFEKGMKVGCIHEVLFYHRWVNAGSAGQTNKTIEMMRDMVHSNFLKVGVDISREDLWLIGPWNGRLVHDSDILKLQQYLKAALEYNLKTKVYDQECLKKVFDLRLCEAKTGILPGLSNKKGEQSEEVHIEVEKIPENQNKKNEDKEKKSGLFRKVLKFALKPIYQPFRHRYEERIANIQEMTWDMEKLSWRLEGMVKDGLAKSDNLMTKVDKIEKMHNKQVDYLYRLLVGQEEQINHLYKVLHLQEEQGNVLKEQKKELNENKNELKQEIYNRLYWLQEDMSKGVLFDKAEEVHRHIDFVYRDIMIALENQTPYLPDADISVETMYPIAYESLDHLFPHGTIRDNTRYPRFVKKCETIMNNRESKELAFLDMGCSGGGMVLEAALRGHLSFGLEGSDASLKEQRAEWRLLGNRLMTCDITKPFVLRKKNGDIQKFDVITAWEVMEHIAEADLPQLFENIKVHLKSNGIFVASIANWDDIDPVSGVNWHINLHPYDWWKDIFENAGFEVCSELFDAIDLARGGYNPPHCYEKPYPEIDKDKTFYIAVRIA